MTDSDRIVGLLDKERAALLAALDQVPHDDRASRPSENVWSVAEVVEHISRIDTGVARLIAHSAAHPTPVDPAVLAHGQLTPVRAAQARDRSVRLEAPERVQPVAGVTFDDAVAHAQAARTALVAAFRGASPEVLDGAVFPHPYFGVLTMRAWVELAAHHEARHVAQIAERTPA